MYGWCIYEPLTECPYLTNIPLPIRFFYPPKTFQPFRFFRKPLQINGLRLNGFALQTLHNHSACAPAHPVQVAPLRVSFRHAQQPELFAEPRDRHALQRLW